MQIGTILERSLVSKRRELILYKFNYDRTNCMWLSKHLSLAFMESLVNASGSEEIHRFIFTKNYWSATYKSGQWHISDNVLWRLVMMTMINKNVISLLFLVITFLFSIFYFLSLLIYSININIAEYINIYVSYF